LSVVGFNFMPWLENAQWLPYASLLAVAITAAVTFAVVIVWTEKIEA
jgi:hypothetical protein